MEVEEDDILKFQTKEKEEEWLRNAFTGRLKEDFSWKDHGEELQKECGGKLTLIDMGDNQILIKTVLMEKV